MEPFTVARDAARKKLHAADHMLSQTYPLVKDPKLLVGVLMSLDEALDHAIRAYLLYEHSRKRVPMFSDTRQGRYTAFAQNLSKSVPKEFLSFLGELREDVKEHEKSPMEFTRKETFVIADEEYHMIKLSEKDMKNKVRQAKTFLGMIEEKVNRNDAVIARRS